MQHQNIFSNLFHYMYLAAQKKIAGPSTLRAWSILPTAGSFFWALQSPFLPSKHETFFKQLARVARLPTHRSTEKNYQATTTFSFLSMMRLGLQFHLIRLMFSLFYLFRSGIFCLAQIEVYRVVYRLVATVSAVTGQGRFPCVIRSTIAIHTKKNCLILF